MIRPVVSRPVRTGAAVVAVAGIALLAGCTAGTEAAETDSNTGTDTTAEAGSPTDSSVSGDGTYVDGTYTADGSYSTPESVETISVTLTLAGDVVTDVQVTGDPQKRESEQYQSDFIGGISAVVVGQDIDEISVSRVAGSSLTSGGFNQAVDVIKAEAAV